MALSLDSQMVRLALLSSMESVSGRQLGGGGVPFPLFLGMKLRASSTLEKCFTSEPYSQPDTYPSVVLGTISSLACPQEQANSLPPSTWVVGGGLEGTLGPIISSLSQRSVPGYSGSPALRT